jgi:glycosyltransferase involved in cell wall biosynthesis
MMGCPRHYRKVLASKKPLVATMGKPESREEHQAVNRVYSEECDLLTGRMLEVIQSSPKVVFISHYVKDIWEKVFAQNKVPFLPEDRWRVIHHGVDVDWFCPDATRGFAPPGPFVIGLVGFQRNRFRLETLFRVSQQLPFEHKLLLVGKLNEECESVMRHFIADSQLKARIVHVPWVDADNLPRYYNKMHCLFHPVDYEGFGLVVAEALACGTPVVVPAHGAPKEYILPGAGVAVDTRQFVYDDEYCVRMAEGVCLVREDWLGHSTRARESAVSLLSIRNVMNSYLTFMGLPLSVTTGV